MSLAADIKMKHLYILITVLLLHAFLASADTFKVGDLYYFVNLETKEATVTYKDYNNGWGTSYISGYVTIPSTIEINNETFTVTCIGNMAFAGCSGLRGVTFPPTVTTINDGAFARCSGISQITIPATITNINGSAFRSCHFTKVTIEDSEDDLSLFEFPESINDLYLGRNIVGSTPSPFGEEIKNLTIGGKVSRICDYCFFGCKYLSKLDLKNVVEIGDAAFVGCNGLSEIVFPSSIKVIHDSAFANCEYLKNISFDDGISEINNSSFYGCKRLRSVLLPNTITKLGKEAFANCTELNNITIPITIDFIDATAFENCESLLSCNLKSTLTTLLFTLYNGLNSEVTSPMFKFGIFDDDKYFDNNNKSLIENLMPGKEYWVSLGFLFKDKFIDTKQFYAKTSDLVWTLDYVTSSSLYLSCKYDELDLDDLEIIYKNERLQTNELCLYGLTPNTNIAITKYYKGKNMGTQSFKTSQLVIQTEPGKALDYETELLSAIVNVDENEESVGFEWRRYDAPESLPSSRVLAIVTNDKIMGVLGNLKPDVYYNYRPYYIDKTGNEYFGDWVTIFTGDAGVFFEPSIYTYDAIVHGPRQVELCGFVLRGTEAIIEQGFEYWSNNSSYMRSNNVNRVEAQGNKIKCLIDLPDYGTEYTYRTYVKTANGESFGEEKTFTLEMSGIEDVNAQEDITIVGYYNLQGVLTLTPSKGLNIVKFSDGSYKKVLYR